jgi:hypothetical protein
MNSTEMLPTVPTTIKGRNSQPCFSKVDWLVAGLVDKISPISHENEPTNLSVVDRMVISS